MLASVLILHDTACFREGVQQIGCRCVQYNQAYKTGNLINAKFASLPFKTFILNTKPGVILLWLATHTNCYIFALTPTLLLISRAPNTILLSSRYVLRFSNFINTLFYAIASTLESQSFLYEYYVIKINNYKHNEMEKRLSYKYNQLKINKLHECIYK